MEINDKEYKRCKFVIKKWELKFKAKENRMPTKDDIKNASRTVKEAYKMYWLAKTSLLEETIIDDEKELSTNNEMDIKTKDNETDVSTIKIDHVEPNKSSSESNVVIETSEMKLREITFAFGNESSELKKVSELTNSETVWGDHLKKAVMKNNETRSKKSSSSQFTEKLFKGLKFKKRNPRKSLISAQQAKSSENKVTNENDAQNSTTDVSSCLENTQEADDSDLVFDCPNVKITAGKSFISSEPVNILRDVENLSGVRSKINIKLDQGWLERCNKSCNLDNKKDMTEKIIEKRDSGINSAPSSDEDYVYSSEDESCKKVTSMSFLCKSFSDEGVSNTFHEDVGLDVSSTQAITNTPNEIDLNWKTVSETVSGNSSKAVDEEEIGQKRVAIEEDPKPAKKVRLNASVDFDTQRKLQRLEQKISSGKVNENFVSININKKRYVRGKKTATFSKYKKQQWKMKKKYNSVENSSDSTGVMKCFKCGDVGHFSKQCRKRNSLLLPLEEYDDTEESPFPTLEEAAEMVQRMNKKNSVSGEVEDVLQICDSLEPPESDEKFNCVPPLYECNNDGTIQETPEEVFEALRLFGYDEFRSGQEKVIMRILSGKSTLFVSGTGSGKSLCYQIPAYLYAARSPCLSLIISPLVSLMEDQVLNFPRYLNAACLHTNQTTQQREKILEKLNGNKISVLLISPEAMVSGERGILGRNFMKKFPPIAFVCIDEVHCVSQWSHNFRTSYLLLCNILRVRFNVRTFLGLTATATSSTIRSITEHLGVADDEEAVLQESILPQNLILSASADEEKDMALLRLLTEPPFSEYNSIIVYCLRRNECERLATFLRTSLQGMRKPLQKFEEKETVSRDAEVYHAGISAARRKKVQKYFMEGKIRIVVATVAFGMGINKADIRGIIHYNLPRTFEHYVQEIGRAGRDGDEARCHLFYDAKGGDIPELKRHIYSNSIDRHVIRKLLQNVFVPCQCKDKCKKHEVAFSIDSTVKVLDLNQENISTLLCYLELLPQKIAQTLPPAYTMCSVQSYDGILPLQRAAKKCAPLAYVIAEHTKKNGSLKTGDKIEFPVMKLANKIGWDSGTVKRELKLCEWTEVNGKYKKTGIIVNFSDVGFHVKSPGNLSETELDEALDALYKRVRSQENTGLAQLEICNRAFESVAFSSVNDYFKAVNLYERSDKLKEMIKKYFVEDVSSESSKSTEVVMKNEASVMCEIHRLVSSHRDCAFTGRTIARIFHGIESPNFPALIWARSPFWRCELKEDFNALCKLASRELITLR